MTWETYADIVSKFTNVTPIQKTSKFLDDLYMDSFQMMLLITDLENRKYPVECQELSNLLTAEDLYQLIERNEYGTGNKSM